jgi:hypothetical protein
LEPWPALPKTITMMLKEHSITERYLLPDRAKHRWTTCTVEPQVPGDLGSPVCIVCGHPA